MILCGDPERHRDPNSSHDEAFERLRSLEAEQELLLTGMSRLPIGRFRSSFVVVSLESSDVEVHSVIITTCFLPILLNSTHT